MTKDDIFRLAGENEDTIAERKRCTEKLAVLDAGFRDLKLFEKHRSRSSGEKVSLYSYPVSFLQAASVDRNEDKHAQFEVSQLEVFG